MLAFETCYAGVKTSLKNRKKVREREKKKKVRAQRVIGAQSRERNLRGRGEQRQIWRLWVRKSEA